MTVPRMTTFVECRRCSGSGYEWVHRQRCWVQCWACQGNGHVEVSATYVMHTEATS